MTREQSWQQFAKDHGFPPHEHGPTEAQPRLSTRNYFRQCFEAGWDMMQKQIDREAVTQ